MTTTSERLAVEGGRPTRSDRLPLHKPWFDHREASAVSRVLAGTHVAGDGACGKELERLLRDSTGVRGVLAVNSCTAALEMAMDELADALGMDPVELRVRNEPPVDPATGRPFSSR